MEQITAETETMKRHPLAVAWDEWIATDEGQHCRAPNAALAREGPYLENRLHRAFDAGAKAASLSPSDTEQLIRLREAAKTAIEALDLACAAMQAATVYCSGDLEIALRERAVKCNNVIEALELAQRQQS